MTAFLKRPVFLKGPIFLKGHVRSALAAVLLLAAAACNKPPETAAAPAAPAKGLPMWVIKDADSTIYLTGTVHALPPDLVWTHPRLEAAVKDADELWLEVPMKSDQAAMMAEMMPLTMKYMLNPGKPLSSLLTPEEKTQLITALERSKLPPATAQGLEMMKPWVATTMIGVGPLLAGGYQADAGVDVNILKWAEEQGDAIKGFETMEEQMEIIGGGTEEEQLAGLRAAISAPAEKTEEMLKKSEEAFESWAVGDTDKTEALFSEVSADDTAGVSLDRILYDRNANWANQIEKLLKEDLGVSFIAVGAGHLMGPKNLRDLLKAKGIEAVRY